MKIVVDAMGGDRAPGVVVEGAIRAARDLELEIIFVGQRSLVDAELGQHDTTGLALTVHHASEVIRMDEHPAVAVKTDSSLLVVLNALKNVESSNRSTMLLRESRRADSSTYAVRWVWRPCTRLCSKSIGLDSRAII